ncbi:hypothetical protein FNV43_RR19923 [Rhamnella rubrinervis]|uniref:RNase H type-1 domain-containing protein n=1 Tax=Rhamnella rubrinervis TaxID=2594499 RepID=A0A8K0GWM7_9ROSA|nr:hypothetical protein FNV43_RR19923 [Rhamnella rubrinervis]
MNASLHVHCGAGTGSARASNSSGLDRWVPPLAGWIKVNVDAAYNPSRSAAAMVVRDASGRLLFLSSALLTSQSPFEAELSALHWSSEFAERGGWTNGVWEMDALEVVKEIESSSGPHCRICNMIADAAAKETLVSGSCFEVDEFSLEKLPPSLLVSILAEQDSAGL